MNKKQRRAEGDCEVSQAGVAVLPSTPGRITKSSKRLSTDQQALDKLYAATQDVRVLWALQQRRLRMVVSDLSKEFDADGRVRSSISLVKETGRMAASKSPLGTGTNLMALNKDLLRICVADEGCELGKFDLEGADSWTVAAECAALGDEMMLLDLRAGLKPAKVLCLLYELGSCVNELGRSHIIEKLRFAQFPSWLYPAAKSTIHGYCYGSGWETTRDTILKYSMADLPLELGEAKPIVLSKAKVEKLRAAAASRYPGIKLWHQAEGKALLERGWLDMSTGHRRLFFGRKAEWKHGHKLPNHDTLKEWLASKPQYYTTLVVKKALWNLWHDPENRQTKVVHSYPGAEPVPIPRLRVEPLMARHDELLVQWRVEDRAWALEKMKGWLTTELSIAGQRVVIPAEGKAGGDWSMQ